MLRPMRRRLKKIVQRSFNKDHARRAKTLLPLAAGPSVRQAARNDYGYLRSRWSSELLALVLKRLHAVKVHASTVRRLLSRRGFVWRRARPILNRRAPKKNEKLRAITRALKTRRPGIEVFYVDEAEVDFNPRIGPAWTRRG